MKEYHKIGEIYGQPVLVEVQSDDDKTKAILYDFVRNGVLPKWIAADPRPHAILFEKMNPLYKMPELTPVGE